VDPRSPVLVGIAAVEQRCDDPAQGREALELMQDALEAAGRDAGSRRLLAAADSIRVPRGFWDYADPGRSLLEAVGAPRARSVLAEIGVLQQTLLSDACRAIAAGEEEVALVVGGEARDRDARARRAGIQVPRRARGGSAPDVRLEPREALIHPLELERGLGLPVRAFAVIESALRHAAGLSLEAHLAALARLWADFSEVAQANPHAWLRRRVTADEIRTPSAHNRWIAFPYARLHCSDWNVDQAAALVLCSVAAARRYGVPRERWVFPRAAAECNHVVPLAARPALHRSPGAAAAGAAALRLAGLGIDEIAHLDLYSCFPAPVQIFASELRVTAARPLTVTGGMAFAGGPLNHYVFQATVRMAERLRTDPGSVGLVSSISGFLNKQGYGIWSGEPPPRGFACADATREVSAASAPRALASDYAGPARVAGCTVAFAGDEPSEAIAVCELPDGRRTLARTRDPELAAAMTREEWCGRDVAIRAQGALACD
jgi:acetyl-CoA C-acetyltransferase